MKLRINGIWRELPAAARHKTLLTVLRDELRLTGTKQGCTIGVCGLCSVLMGGELVSACLILPEAIDGADITTIEGLDQPELQQAFVDHAGLQCGICTPGQIIAATALLHANPRPSTEEIKRWMTGNLCRCTGYGGIVESIEAAAAAWQSGQPSDRLDAPGKVSGSTQYTDDLVRPGMLVGQVLRSPHPHARIVSIDTERATALPGVYAVLVDADIPSDVRLGRNMRDIPVLARDKVCFVGEKVAAVAAESPEIAAQALALIDVEYAELPAVFDPIQAMQPAAPLIHSPDDVRTWAVRDQVVPDYPNGASAPTYGASQPEIEAALTDAPHVFEHTFRTSMQHQAYLEPHCCLVEVDDDGVAHIWAAQKAPLLLARYLREGLGLRREQLDIHLMPLGGDFGGKGSFMDIPLAYLLSRASGRPVKMAMSYVDELTAANPRHAAIIVVRSAVDDDGRLLARWVRGYFASGGYAAFKPSTDTTLPGFRRGALGPYAIPAFRAECHMIYTNSVPCGHMRSPGEAQVAYAIEAHTDLIAREMGIDPVAFRVLNATRHTRSVEDTSSRAAIAADANNATSASKTTSAAIAAQASNATDANNAADAAIAADASNATSAAIAADANNAADAAIAADANNAADTAIAADANNAADAAIAAQASNAADANSDELGVPSRAVDVLQAAANAIGWQQPRPSGIGRGVALIEFSTSPGIYASILRVARDGQVTIQTPIVEQGAGMLTVFRRIVAEELGVPIQRIGIDQSVEGIEDDRGVGGSRTTRLVGKVLIELSRRVQARLTQLVAAEFGASTAEVGVVPGGFNLVHTDRLVTFEEAAALLDDSLSESLVYHATEQDRSTVFLAQAAEVSVDRETGAVRPLRVVTVQEVGRIVEPLLARRQIEGAVLQGLGYATMEQLVLDEGRVLNPNLHDYKLPTQVDTPLVETIMLGHDPRLGLTPIGEAAVAGVAPAIVNAVVDVVGPKVFCLPLSPEMLLTV